MTERASFSLRNRNPDVLTCIANLSNDEVFTPPDLANQMLDMLEEAWALTAIKDKETWRQDIKKARQLQKEAALSRANR